jgi:bifunctional DNase/RNase
MTFKIKLTATIKIETPDAINATIDLSEKISEQVATIFLSLVAKSIYCASLPSSSYNQVQKQPSDGAMLRSAS